jgi:hypothetical protein
MRILTLFAIPAFVLLVAALVHAHEKHTAPALPPPLCLMLKFEDRDF